MNHLCVGRYPSAKGIKLKHAISLTLLLVLGIWFHCQLKHSQIKSPVKNLGRKGNIGPNEGFEMDFNDGMVTMQNTNGDDDNENEDDASRVQDFLKHDENQIQEELRLENLENDIANNHNVTESSEDDNVENSDNGENDPKDEEIDEEKASKYDAETGPRDENDTDSKDDAEENDVKTESNVDADETEDVKLFQDEIDNNSGSGNVSEVHINKINDDEDMDSSIQVNEDRGRGSMVESSEHSSEEVDAEEELKSDYSGMSDLQK